MRRSPSPLSGFPSLWSCIRHAVLVCLHVAVMSDAAAAALIEGRVTLAEAKAPTVINQRYEVVVNAGVVSTEPPLAVVYVEGSFPKQSDLHTPQITQKGLVFSPSVLPVQVGTRVEFPNEDDVYHNIFSYSRPKRFDLGRYRADERPIPSVVFDKPGLVTLRCDIHDHMRALVLVLDTPHFVMTDAEGRYRLSGVPPGSYTLKAWLNSQTTREVRITVPAEGTVRADMP